jgi:NAD(P)H-dependent FMN reductase
MSRIDELLQQRAAIDAELAELKAQAERDLAAMQDKLREISQAMGAQTKPRPVVPRESTPLDETDAGNGVREADNYTTAEDFTDELAELRARSLARRAR